MRTTMILPDELYSELREAAAQDGRTMTSVVEDALREALRARLQARNESRPYVVTPLPAGSGLQRGVDLDDNAGLEDLMSAS